VHELGFDCPEAAFHLRIVESNFLSCSYFEGGAGYSSEFGLTLKHLAWPGRGVPVVGNHEEDVFDLFGLKYILTIRHVRYVQRPASGR
jgi:hypothetical protein